MIKFFRKIRQNLLSENKFSKYLIYAIGEIVLVVIGILIALQINNWNEKQKAKLKQVNLFENLKIDFNTRLNELNEMMNGKSESILAISELNKIIAKKQPKPKDSLFDFLLSRTVNGYKFNEDFKMLDVVFYTGLINEVDNQELKRQLIEWPQLVEEMLEEQRMHNNLIDNRLVPFYSEKVSMRDIYEKFNFRQYNLSEGQLVTLKKDYSKLLANPLFENFLAESEILIRISLKDIKNLISTAEKIIKLIDAELKT